MDQPAPTARCQSFLVVKHLRARQASQTELINRLLQLRQLYKRIIQHDTALNPCQIRELARTAPRSKLETWLHLIVEYKYTKMFWPTVSVTVSCLKQLTPACWLLPCQHFYLYHQVIIVTLTLAWPAKYLSQSSRARSEEQLNIKTHCISI